MRLLNPLATTGCRICVLILRSFKLLCTDALIQFSMILSVWWNAEGLLFACWLWLSCLFCCTSSALHLLLYGSQTWFLRWVDVVIDVGVDAAQRCSTASLASLETLFECDFQILEALVSRFLILGRVQPLVDICCQLTAQLVADVLHDEVILIVGLYLLQIFEDLLLGVRRARIRIYRIHFFRVIHHEVLGVIFASLDSMRKVPKVATERNVCFDEVLSSRIYFWRMFLRNAKSFLLLLLLLGRLCSLCLRICHQLKIRSGIGVADLLFGQLLRVELLCVVAIWLLAAICTPWKLSWVEHFIHLILVLYLLHLLLWQEFQIVLQVAPVFGHVDYLCSCLEWHLLLSAEEMILATWAVWLLQYRPCGHLSWWHGVARGR